MRVLVIASVSPYPKNVGKRIMLGGICDYLKQSTHVLDFRMASFANVEPQHVEHVTFLPPPSALRKVWNVLWHSLTFETKSLQESFFWNPAAKRKLDSLVEEFQPEMILYDTLRTGQYLCKELSARIHVIYMDDLFSVRYKKMLDVIKAQSLNGINAMGNFGENIPRSLLAIYEKSPMLQKLLLQIERKLISMAENEAPAKFDRALLVSSVEQDILANRTHAENIFSIPPRLDGHSLGSRKWSGAPDFIFLGSLNLAHNAHAIESFIANHLARLTHLIPNVHISIVGRGAAPTLKSMVARNSKHVSLRGFVDDLDALLLSSCAMISPLTFGSGIKLKVIDSLRCGVPLVTTQHGIEGIEVDDGAGILLRDSLEDFPAAMQCLLDPDVNSRTSAANAQLYRRYYSLTAVDNVYRHILLSRKDSPPSMSGTDELTVAS